MQITKRGFQLSIKIWDSVYVCNEYLFVNKKIEKSVTFKKIYNSILVISRYPPIKHTPPSRHTPLGKTPQQQPPYNHAPRHAPTHAQHGLPVNQIYNPAAPLSYGLELHDTAAFHSDIGKLGKDNFLLWGPITNPIVKQA